MRAQSPFFVYVDTEAQVPGKDGASAALIAQFNQMGIGTFVFVREDKALYYKGTDTTYVSGNRIVLLSSGSGGTDGVDGIFSNADNIVSVGSVVSKDINPSNVVLADANDPTKPAFGVVIDVITSTSCVVREFGECVPLQDAAFTVGATVYLSENAGKATTTAPTTAGCVVQKIGTAKSATEVILGITPAFGGGLYTKDGTFAQPAWSFVSDPGTGFLLLNPSEMAVTLGGLPTADFSASQFGYIGRTVAVAVNVDIASFVCETSGTAVAGLGAAAAFQVQRPGGGSITAGRVAFGFETATLGAEVGRADLLAAFAGTGAAAGVRTTARSDGPSLVNGLEVRPITAAAAAATGVALLPYGTSTVVSLSLRAKGTTGSVNFRTAADDATVFAVQNVSAGVWGIAATSDRNTTQTSNGIVGQFQINAGAGAAGVAISNNRVQANATVLILPTRIDSAATQYSVTAVPDGSFTVTTNANQNTNTVYNYIVVNPAA